MTITTDPKHPGLNVDRGDGQNKAYLVLSEEERAKGFVRPVRDSYVHVGIAGPKHPTRNLTAEELERWGDQYAAYEEYPKPNPDGSSAVGRFWSQRDLDRVGKGCGTLTTMARSISETYARQPGHYGATFCCGCGTHLPVGRDGEFVWAGTEERVGT